MARFRGRAAALLALAALVAGVLVGAAPAHACACGGYVGPPGASVAVQSESAALALVDGRETIVLSMGAVTEADDVALLIPTPAPAEVARGGAGVFVELAGVTAPTPRVEYDWWGTGGDGTSAGAAPQATGAPVTVLTQVQLGELEVTTLAASDADALAGWLAAHGYVMRDGLAAAVRPYVAEGWSYAAVRLRPEAAATVSGEMQPLVLTFDADELVYPMRLSAAASTAQHVRTYVFGAHRVDRTDAQAHTAVLHFAAPVAPSDFADPQLARFAEAGFLTAHDQTFRDPVAQITADFAFANADQDAVFRPEYRVTQAVTLLGLPAGPVLVALGVLAAAGAAMAVAARRRNQAEAGDIPGVRDAGRQ
ncbi:DUF2330 domain-containing protein [Propioniciclava coleopterorum]|uniref:DUF2330 domain-containing protein n=1 Tax=Propioniciclava coleopterorum TaxID=2714937 RepID=A0A6G7Y8A7_9ACTN|nr:DUF2330 domain-containing protein [Propioniciclava coleopterorum]QIK73010.1 DUF2330 domain-containing protein [Propioniciclava coleopterorum]